MSKVIDSFLFFQELDLLEIRLDYLDKYVDTFVIVEACQTFSGNPKKFVFQENSKRFAKYLHKIEYLKINDFHSDYESVQLFLKRSGTLSHEKISSILNQHNHYPKDQLNWVLDTYHRECIHLALDKIAEDGDVVILSDLDEIPSRDIFNDDLLSLMKAKPRVCQQKEFRYFLNYYKDSKWLGSIAGKYLDLKEHSFNMLRIDSKHDRTLVHKDVITNGGYHFTSCGDILSIKEKIKSWGHQEFNNALIDKNIEKNILTGQDIFQRETGTNLKRVEVSDVNYFDQDICRLLLKHRHMLSFNEIEVVEPSFFSDFSRRLLMALQKVQYKIALITKKNNRY